MFKCPMCVAGTLYWNSDFNYDEVHGEGEGVVSFYTCSNPECAAEAQFSLRTDKENIE